MSGILSSPKDLKIDDKIFTIESHSLDDNELVKLAKAKYYSKKSIVVDSIAKNKTNPGYITVNGLIDIPEVRETPKDVQNVFYTSENEVDSVLKQITTVEMQKIEDLMSEISAVKDMLKAQIDENRF